MPKVIKEELKPIHQELIDMLGKLIPCIEGRYIMSDGALLGLIRDGGFISHDDDIDIYLLPDSSINLEKLKSKGLDLQKYYLCDKIYNPKKQKYKSSNRWREFLSYTITLPEYQGLNRFELIAESSKIYGEQYIEPEFSLPNIDIFYLEEWNNEYYLPYYYPNKYGYSELVYDKDMIYYAPLRDFHGVMVRIPHNPIRVLRMIYGLNWWIPERDKSFIK